MDGTQDVLAERIHRLPEPPVDENLFSGYQLWDSSELQDFSDVPLAYKEFTLEYYLTQTEEASPILLFWLSRIHLFETCYC